MKRVFNFSAGPAILPEEVLKRAADEMLDWNNSGQSVMEMSHRGKEFISIANAVEKKFRDLLKIPSNYKILFLQGGASLQFEMIPMNLLADGNKKCADYVNTGEWSKKAIKAAEAFGTIRTIATSEDKNFTYAPLPESWKINQDATYVHYTSNETIGGVEFQKIPEVGKIPLVCDMSSNILSCPIDVSKFALIYAGAQKNIGPAGLTIVIIRDDLIKPNSSIPTMLQYITHAGASSMYNTPPTYAIYIAGLVLDWINTCGGLAEIEKINIQKSKLLYDFIDGSKFYKNPVAKENRSRMNIPFTLAKPELDDAFLKGAIAQGLIQLQGHRSVGGMRASLYNAMPIDGVKKLINYMKNFENENS